MAGEPLPSPDWSVVGFICAASVQVTNNYLLGFLVLEPEVLRSEKIVSLDG